MESVENDHSNQKEKAGSKNSWMKKFVDTVINTVKDFSKDQGTQWAAAISYYSLLSIFPLLLATISIMAYVASPEWAVKQITSELGKFMPIDLSQIDSIVTNLIHSRGTASIISLISLLWSGTGVFASIHTALNIAYNVDTQFGLVKGTLFKFIMLLGIALLFVVAYIAQYVVNFIGNELGLILPNTQIIVSLLLGTVFSLLLFLAFFILYRYVPVRKVEWQAAAGGAFFSTVLFIAARSLFVVYLKNFAHYSLVYGSIATIIILIFWIWIMATILILGGELVANIQKFFFGDKFVNN